MALPLALAAAFMRVMAVYISSTAAAKDAGSKVTKQRVPAALRGVGKLVEVFACGELREVFAVPGGRWFLAGEHVQPVRTIGGEWMAVDAHLDKVAAGVTRAVTTAGVTFSVGGTGPIVALTGAGETVSLTGPRKRPDTPLKGDPVVYASVHPGIGVRLSADKGGCSRVLAVKTAEAGQDR